MKLHGCRFMYFFSLCDVRNEVVFLILEHSQTWGVKQKKNMRKNTKFCLLNTYYKRFNWKTWLSETFSEALISKLWNKKNTCCQSLKKWSETELYSLPYGIQGIATWNSQEKIKLAIPCEQNYVAWLFKNRKTVFSKLIWKIYLSVSDEQGEQALGL